METRGVIFKDDKNLRTSEIWRTVTQNVSNALSDAMGN